MNVVCTMHLELSYEVSKYLNKYEISCGETSHVYECTSILKDMTKRKFEDRFKT